MSLWLLLLLVAVSVASASLYDGKTFHMCMLWWSNIGDGGYTDEHQSSLTAALQWLQAKHPLVNFDVVIKYNVYYEPDKANLFLTMMNTHACNLVYFAYSDLFPNSSFLLQQAAAYPNTLFTVGDSFFYNETLPKNVFVTEPICDQEWFVAGVLAASTFPNSAPVMVVSFETATAWASHAFGAGVRYSSSGSLKSTVVAVNGWSEPEREKLLASLALSSGTEVVTHFSDPYVVSQIAHESGKHSIGWDHNDGAFYLDTVLTSVVRSYTQEIFDLVDELVNGVAGQRYRTYHCSLTSFSNDVSPAVKSLISTMNATVNISKVLWGEGRYFDYNGNFALQGPLSMLQVATLSFVTNYSKLNPAFVGNSACPSDSSASFVSTPYYRTICTPCSSGYYSRNGSACAPCTGVFASYCAATPSSTSSTTTIIIIVVASCGGIIVIVAALCIIRIRRKNGTLVTTAPNEPISIDSNSERRSVTLSEWSVDVPQIMDAIRDGKFHLGSMSSCSFDPTVRQYKCYLSSGFTISLLRFGKFNTPEECAQMDATLPATTAHPNLIRVFAVQYNKEHCTCDVFCEAAPGGSLSEMLRELHGQVSESRAQALAQGILAGLHFLHERRYPHRHLDVPHILMSSSGSPKVIVPYNEPLSDDQSLSVAESTMSTPPEFLDGSAFSEMGSLQGPAGAIASAMRGDVWSFGVLCATIANGGSDPWPPGSTLHELLEYVRSGGTPCVVDSVSAAGRALVGRCCLRNPAMRPTLEELLEHPWMREVKSQQQHVRPVHDSVRVAGAKSLYQIGKILGVGSFGTVHQVSFSDGRELAMKTVSIDLGDVGAAKRLRRAMREVELVRSISHPNIVRYEFIESDIVGSIQHVKLFMELIKGGTLKQLCATRKLTEEDVGRLVVRILSALEHIHGLGIVHRDVKPSNFLYCGPPELVKLADFGSASLLDCGSTASGSMQGTLLYMAPEILREEIPTSASDIWSVGATTMELATGLPPWSHVIPSAAAMPIVAYVASSEELRLPPNISQDLASFLSAALRREPTQRATATKLLEHPFVSSVREANDKTGTQ